MANSYNSRIAKIIEIIPQSEIIKLFRLKFTGLFASKLSFKPGQIIILSIPGIGEAPFAPCNPPDSKYLELCIRKVGRVTEKIHSLKVGDKVGIRGPYGNGWPIEKNQELRIKNQKGKKNLLIVVGGLGLIPLRTLIWGKDKFLGKDAGIQLFYGAKTPNEFLFINDFEKWRERGIDVCLTIDKECPGWDDCVGVVTTLFDKKECIKDAHAFLCGPPIMYKFVMEKLKEPNHCFDDKDIFMSLERRMHCGIGVCQHCAIGPKYTCKDGPVFSYEKLKIIEGAI